MEKHVRKQQANAATEPENNHKPESEKSPSTERSNIESIGDIVQAIKAGDKSIENVLLELTQNLNKFCDGITGIQSRIVNIETFMEAQQLSNVTILDKLAKIGMAFVTFVAKFGTKKDVDASVDEVEENGKKKE